MWKSHPCPKRSGMQRRAGGAGGKDGRLSLRRKTVLAIAGVFVALVLVLNLITWIFVLGGYDTLEEDSVRENVSRAVGTFADSLESLATTCRDWAYWDDTYGYIADRNQGYVESNLTASTFENLGLDVIIYVDAEGDIVYGSGFDPLEGAMLSLPPDLEERVRTGLPLLRPGAGEDEVAGVTLLEEGPLLLSSVPILTSEGKGAARGSLIMGRYLDDTETGKLADISNLNIAIVRFDGDSMPEDYRTFRDMLLAGDAEADVRVLGSDSIAGYSLIDDIYGNPALILRVEMPRAIHRQGIDTLVYFNIFLFAACLVFGVTVVFLLEKMVLSRLSNLSAEITGIGLKGDPAARVSVEGKDELANLATAINTMMDRIERSEGRFLSLTENALDMTAILGPDTLITYESPSIEKTLGYSRGYFARNSAFELVHPDDETKVQEALQRVMERPGNTEQTSIRFRDSGGSWRHLLIIGYNLLDEPSVGGIVVNARDITDSVTARERLESINRLFTRLGADPLENMIMIVRTAREALGVDFVKYGRMDKMRYFIATSEPGEEEFREVYDPEGYLCFDIVDKDLKEPLVIEDIVADGFVDASPVARKRGYGFFVGHPVVLSRRTVGCLSLYASTPRALTARDLDTLGTLAHALGVEEERLANERNIKEFLDITGHELRHPITLMKGYALTLRDHGDRLEESSRREFLDLISANADRMDDLIGELLDVSRIESGRFTLNRHMASVELLARRAVDEMRNKGWDCRYELEVGGGISPLFIDPEKILRVLIILLDNAGEHSPAGATVTLSAEKGDGAVTVSVLDHGTGVPEAEREHIFERFYQVKGTPGAVSAGMGLGLYIAREIVEAHGGRIWHEPGPETGSVFRFTIPGDGDAVGGS